MPLNPEMSGAAGIVVRARPSDKHVVGRRKADPEADRLGTDAAILRASGTAGAVRGHTRRSRLSSLTSLCQSPAVDGNFPCLTERHVTPMPPTFAARLHALLIMLAVATAGSSALGQDPGPSGFDQADANHDGIVDPDEWDQSSARLFDQIDTNGDGLASPAELGRSYDTFDYNHDGVIEGGESPLVIILGDTDGDGRVSPSEFDSINWTRKSLDSDGDGAVSRDEFRNARREIYDRADFDRSLTLNRSEYQGAPSLSLFQF
jgi:EF hand